MLVAIYLIAKKFFSTKAGPTGDLPTTKWELFLRHKSTQTYHKQPPFCEWFGGVCYKRVIHINYTPQHYIRLRYRYAHAITKNLCV